MPRRARRETESGLFHVFARGNDRRTIFVDNTDRRRYLSLLGATVRRCEWLALGYCLMPNHVHLLIETQKPNLAEGMGRIQSSYAQAFNRRHNRTGHLFDGRYGSVRVQTNEHLITAVRYIAFNPVKAELAPDPVGWRWSSHRAAVGVEDPPPWLAVDRLTELLDGWSGAGAGAYAELTRT